MSDYLPQDVLVDILTRLPAETLVRLTSVCKSWHSLITNPKFVSHHLNRNANDRLLLVRHRTDEPRTDHYSLVLDGNDSFHHRKALDLPFDAVGYSIVGSCNGVICLSDDLEYGYLNDMFLWNPSIRKFVALPKYNVTFRSHGPFMHCLGYGFDPVTNDFKIVRVVHTGFYCDRIPPLVELYTHKTSCWRDISEKALPLMIMERCRQAYVNGAANWMAITEATPLTPLRNTILSFNMSEEVFNEILVPESITHDDSFMKRMILVVFKESFCLIQQCPCDAEPHCAVWIMKEYGVSTSWSRLFRIDLSGGLRRPLGLRENGEVIFATKDGNLVSCDHKSRRLTYLGICGTFGDGYSHWHTFYTDTYTESLELLKKLESPENTVVSGQKKKKNKKKKKKEDEKKEQHEADWTFTLERKVEEGICEAISYEWLKYTVTNYDPSYTQKEAEIAKRVRIEEMSTIETGKYVAEFREARRAIKKYGLKPTWKHVARLRDIPE